MSAAVRRRWLVLAAGGALALLLTQPRTGAQETERMKADLAALDRKLNDVAASQRAILDKLDEVLEELEIVKVRCTVRR